MSQPQATAAVLENSLCNNKRQALILHTEKREPLLIVIMSECRRFITYPTYLLISPDSLPDLVFLLSSVKYQL